MTARDIQRRLLFDLYRTSTVIPNYTPRRWWECDVWEITKAGYFREYEIKVSRADLLGDLKRPDKRAAYLDLGGHPTKLSGSRLPRTAGSWQSKSTILLRHLSGHLHYFDLLIS